MGASHVVLSTVGRMPLFADEADRRRALRTIARVLGADLVLFVLVDDHLHLVLLDALAPPGRHLQALRLALARLPGFVPLQPTWTGKVSARTHAEALLGYALGQSAKHRLPGHPARWSGSCLADLAGARRLDGFDQTAIVRLLPRFRVDDALKIVGVRPLMLPDAATLRALGAGAIAEASAAAYAVTDVGGLDAASSAARRAAVAVQREAGISPAETSFSLGLASRTTRHLRATVAPADGDVTRRRLALDLATARELPRG